MKPYPSLFQAYTNEAMPVIVVFEPKHRVNTEVTFGRGDLRVYPLWGLTGAHECFISDLRGVPQGSPQRQTLRALLPRGISVLH